MADPGGGKGGATASARPPPLFDVEQLATVPRALLVAVIAALALTVVFVSLPPRPIILRVVQKLGHPAVFSVIAVALLTLASRRGGPRAAWRDYVFALAGCALLGAATEAAQAFTHRDPSWLDVGRDVRGAACALALAAACDRRVYGRRALTVRSIGFAVAAALALWIAAPLAESVAAYAKRARDFPVLFAPRGALDLYFVLPDREALQLADDAAGRVLRIGLREPDYLGITIDEPSPDWRGFRALRIDAGNPAAGPLELHVRVNDAWHDQSYDDRYNEVFVIDPHSRRAIEIPLERIAGAPRTRHMDLAHVASIVLFHSGPGPDEFELYGIELR